ncbi:phosphotransferase [Luteimicrobium sp. NPDC057192]|uniref:phosphotransferase n=1 Tax=Luteimicrobium sp. NPDC057192 TaxID=3346042 RepID=UPI003625BBAE
MTGVDASPHVPSDLAGAPAPDVAVPAVVTRLAAGDVVAAVWENAVGGLTFRLGDGPRARFVKWAPATDRAAELDLAAEAERLAWAGRFTPVPRVLDAGTDDDGATWLVTAALAGESAVSERWRSDPRTAVRAIGEGLRALHDALPVAECPFDWGVASRVARGRTRPDADPALLDRLAAEAPEPERLVVCHGDACAPNTLLGDDGRWLAHVDLGTLGVADRWADLAVATYSTGWNYGPGWEDELLAAYGTGADVDRTAYYRALWDAT